MSTTARRVGNQNVYQIDFTAVASGKRIANTKRRVRWRFGFTNLQALENGETGTACRGEEHDITLVWSVTSGKRLVLADGQEVHYSNSRGNTFEFSWTMRGNHVLKIIAHASAPISATNTFRQYDFFIDGQSFFSFPKVYRLGLSGGRGAEANRSQIVSVADRGDSYRNYDLDGRASGNIAAIEAPHNEVEEEAYLAEAIKNSLEDAKVKTPASSVSSQPTALPIAPALPEGDLLDFFSEPAPAAPLALPPSNPDPQYPPFAAPPAAYTQPPPQPSFTQPSPQQFDQTPLQPFIQPPPQQSFTPQHNQPAPTPPQHNQPPPFQPSPFDAPASYQQPPPPTQAPPVPSDPFAPSADPFKPFAATPVPPDPFAPQPPQPPNPLNLYTPPTTAPTPNGNPLSFNTLTETNDGKISGSNADQAYSKLLNGFSLEKKETTKHNPFDTNSNLGPQPTLGSLQTNKPQTTKKEVMSSGAMVVSSTQSGNWGYGAQTGQYQYPPYQQSFNQSMPNQMPGQSFSGGYNPNNSYQYPPPQQQPPYQQSSMNSGFGASNRNM